MVIMATVTVTSCLSPLKYTYNINISVDNGYNGHRYCYIFSIASECIPTTSIYQWTMVIMATVTVTSCLSPLLLLK